MIAGRSAATIALHHRRKVQPVDHLDDKPCEMPLGKPFIERRRKQKPRRAVKPPEIAHQAHPASESIPPSYRVRHVICQVRQAARKDKKWVRLDATPCDFGDRSPCRDWRNGPHGRVRVYTPRLAPPRAA